MPSNVRAHGRPLCRDWLSQARLLREGRESPVYYDGSSHLRVNCISGDIQKNAPLPVYPTPFADHLRNALYRDLCVTKLPRVLRMNDRVSMAYSRELRQPLIDHRLVEHAFRLPGNQKIRGLRPLFEKIECFREK